MSKRENWTHYNTVFPPANATCRASLHGRGDGQFVCISFYRCPDEMTIHLTVEQAEKLEQSLSNVIRAMGDADDDGMADITDDDRKAELEREEREPAGDHE